VKAARITATLALLALFALVAGCGMYGSLYLEDVPPEPTAPPLAVEPPQNEQDDDPDEDAPGPDEGATAGGS
jgi:predicted small lipoprotein YifL